MKNIVKKIKDKVVEKIQKGFTLVELLAVIVILALIMIIAIPAVLDTMETARKKTFVEFVDKSANLGEQQHTQDQMMGKTTTNSCVIYNIATDLGLNNTGTFKGWVLISPSNNKTFITVYNDQYALVNYEYGSNNNIMNLLSARNEEVEEMLTKEKLCGASSCDSCTLADGETDVVPSASGAFLIDGRSIQSKMVQLAGGNYNAIKEVKFSNVIEDTSTVISTSESEKTVYLWFKDNTIFFGSESNRLYMNPDSQNMFAQLWSVEKIDMSHFYSDYVEDMRNMFATDEKLKSLDLSHFKTSNVWRMTSMFQRVGIENLDLSSFDTSNVYYMTRMFSGSAFKSINVSSFDTSNVLEMDAMFEGNPELETLDLSSFTIGQTHISSMFWGDTKLKTIYASSKWDTSKTVGVRRDNVFYNCTSLPGFDSSKISYEYAKSIEQGGYFTMK